MVPPFCNFCLQVCDGCVSRLHIPAITSTEFQHAHIMASSTFPLSLVLLKTLPNVPFHLVQIITFVLDIFIIRQISSYHMIDQITLHGCVQSALELLAPFEKPGKMIVLYKQRYRQNFKCSVRTTEENT